MAEGFHSPWRLSFALWATALMAATCGSPPAGSVRANSGMAPTSTRVTDGVIGTLVIGDTDNGGATTVSVDQHVTVTLTSTYWRFAVPSATQVLAQEGQPIVASRGPSCPKAPGTGCGTVVATFTALAPGAADIVADRTSCGEALGCSEDQAHWRFHVRVVGPVSTVPIGAPTTIAAINTTVPSRPTTTLPPSTSTTTTITSAGATGVQGTVLFGPVCPVERIPPDPQCAPRPGAARIRVVRSDGVVAAEGMAGVEGRFSIPLAPGTYIVTAAPTAPGPGRGCQVDPLGPTVVARSFVTVGVSCDTGIR